MLQGACITEKKKDKPVLDATITVRTSKDEKARWLQQASDAKLTISDWIRIGGPAASPSVITGRPTPRRAPLRRPSAYYIPVDPALLRALSAIGSNVNQIARHLNSTGAADASVMHALVRMERSLERIAQAAEGSKDAS